MTAPPQGVEVDYVEFPAGRIRFYRAGSTGPAIVLLHGSGLDNGMLSWRHTIPVLAADHRVYVPDLPKQGDSLSWHGRANQRNLEEVLRWLLDAWEITEATLIGISMGASIATGFTLRHPNRINGLVLTDAAGFQSRLDKHALWYALVRTGFLGKLSAKVFDLNRSLVRKMLTRSIFTGSQPVSDLETVVDEVRTEARSRSSALTDWQTDSLGSRGININHLPLLGQIRCPTMVIHGEKDTLVPVASSRAAADALSGSRLRVIDDTGHWPNREKPNEFNALVREFVNNH